MKTYQTRSVLAAARLNKRNGQNLTHTVDAATETPLCSVKPESIADVHGSDPDAAPTCPTCLRRDPRIAEDLRRQLLDFARSSRVED